MKTTIEIDDDLLREAKIRAAEQGVTLRAFVEQGLRHRLSQLESRSVDYVLPDCSVGGNGLVSGADELDMEAIRDEALRWRMWGK